MMNQQSESHVQCDGSEDSPGTSQQKTMSNLEDEELSSQPVIEDNSEPLEENKIFSCFVKMTTKFGTFQVKVLSEKGCNATNIEGWYKLADFNPAENDELAEKRKNWTYAMRLVRISSVEDTKTSVQDDDDDDDDADADADDDEVEFIVLRRTLRGPLSFELPRDGRVHLSKMDADSGDLENKSKTLFLEVSERYKVGEYKKLSFLASSNNSSQPSSTSGFSPNILNSNQSYATLDTASGCRWPEQSNSSMQLLRSAGRRTKIEDKITSQNLSLSLAKKMAALSVSNDIQSIRASYLEDRMKRDSAIEEEDEEEKTRFSARFSCPIEYSGEKRYSTIFPKTAPVKYNKSALDDPNTDNNDEEDTRIPTLTWSSGEGRSDSGNFKKMRTSRTLIDAIKFKLRLSKKKDQSISFSDSTIDYTEDDCPGDQPAECSTSEAEQNFQTSLQECSSTTRMSDERPSLKGIRSKDEGLDKRVSISSLTEDDEEIISIISSDSEIGLDTQSETVAAQSSYFDRSERIVYIKIPKQKIEQFLSRGIHMRPSICEEDTVRSKYISVKRSNKILF